MRILNHNQKKFSASNFLWLLVLTCLLPCLNLACAIHGKTAVDYLIAGNEYYKNQEYERAEDSYRRALELDPKSTNAQNNVGVILYVRKKYEEAIPSLQKAIEIDPKNAIAHYVLANCLVETGKAAEGLEQAKLAISIDPNDTGAYLALARAGKALNQINIAIDAYEHLLQLEPNNEEYDHELNTLLSTSSNSSSSNPSSSSSR